MRCFRWGTWTPLIGLVLVSLAGDVLAAGLCDPWRRANTLAAGLEDAVERLWDQEPALRRKLEKARDRVASMPDLAGEISRLEGAVASKSAAATAKRKELETAQRDAAGQGQSQLQAEIAAAKRKVEEEEAKLSALAKRLKLADRDDQVDGVRGDLEQVNQEYASLFGTVGAEVIMAALRPGTLGCQPHLANTQVCEIAKAIGRKQSYSGSASTAAGSALDRLSLGELEDSDKAERKRLIEFVKKKLKLEADLTKAEDRAVGGDVKKLRKEQAELQRSLTEAQAALDNARNRLQSDKDYAKSLAGNVKTLQAELAKLERELEGLQKDLEQKKAIGRSVEAAEADFNRIHAELNRLEKDKEAAVKDREQTKARLQAAIQELNAAIESAKAAGNRALRARKESNAACEENRSAAISELTKASALAAENRPCVEQSMLDRVNRGLKKTEEINCGSGSRSSGLVEVPPVRNKTQAEVESLLRGAGLNRFQFSEFAAPKVPEDAGLAISSSPAAGQKVPPDTLIVVSTFNNTWQDLTQAEAQVEAAQAAGGGWDAEADKAVVSATIRNQPEPEAPAAPVPADDDGGQADRIREVGDAAIARGPQAAPTITHDTLTGVLAVGNSIAAAQRAGGKTGVSNPTGPSGAPTTAPATGSTKDSGSTKDCTYHNSGVEGDTYYVIDFGGSPKGFEIRRVWDPPKGSADRKQYGTSRGAMKKSIVQSYEGASRQPTVLGPFSSFDQAKRTAQERCR